MKKVKGFALLIIATGLIIPLTVINRRYVEQKYGDTDGYFQNTALNIDIWAFLIYLFISLYIFLFL